jgi:O-antigen/teichoic acid export membrane protein
MGSIKKQGFWNTFISYSGILIGFINILVLQPKMLSATELGLTRILYSTTVLFGTLFPVGLNFLTIKYFPEFKNEKNKHNGYLPLLLLISTCSFLLFSLFLFLSKNYFIAKYSDSPLFVDYFYYIFPMTFFIGINTLLIGYSSALFKTSFPSFLNEVYIRLFVTAITLCYFFEFIPFEWFMRLFLFSYGTQLLMLLIYVHKTDGITLKINWSFFKTKDVKAMSFYTLQLALASVASIAIRNIDTMLVGGYLGLDAVAVYTIAFTIGSIIEAPVNALSRIADSKIADAITRNDQQLIKTVYYKSAKLLSIVGALLFLGVIVNIHDLLSLLPAKYHGGEFVVIIIATSSFFNMASGVNTSLIYFSHLYKKGTYLLYLMISITLVLNIILIPMYGIIGAAIGTGISLLFYNVFKYLLIYKHFSLQPFSSYIFYIIGLFASCLLVNSLLPILENPFLNMFLHSSVVGLIYCSGVLGFKLIPFSLKLLKFN